MIREAIGHALLLAAEAVGALPVSRQWERDLDELRQQVGDLDAAVADGLGGRAKSIDALACRLIETMCASSLQDAVEIAEGYKRDAAAADKEVYRLNATNATLRKDLCEHMAKAYRPYYADRNKMHAALFGAGVKGGPGAWRWHSDPQGTTFSDVAAFCRLMLERLDIGDAPEEATDCADLTTRLDAARDGLKAARTCLARLGEARVVDALLAVERGLARSAPSLSDITTPKSAAEVVREAVAEARVADITTPDPTAEQIEAYLRGSENWELQNGAWESRGLGFDALWKIVKPIGDPAECVAFLARTECRTPAEMRARILAASAPAEPTDEDLGRIARAQANNLGYDAAGRALYNLGREHGSHDRAALLARAEKAERDLADAHGHIPEQLREPVRFHVRDVRALADEWQKRGEELEAVRKELATVRRQNDARRMAESDPGERIRHAPGLGARDTRAPFCVGNGELYAIVPDKLADTHATAPTPDPIDKDAALREAGWRYKPHHGWTFGAYAVGYIANTEDAYWAMVEDREREKALAATPRDTLAQPEPGDLYVDTDGLMFFCLADGVIHARASEITAGEYGSLRPATHGEAYKFRKDHGL